MAKKRAAPRRNAPPSPGFPRVEMGVPLTATVQGQKASDLEERFARALSKLNRNFIFQYVIPAYDGAPIANLPGEVHLDFLDVTDIPRPYAVDDVSFIHKGAEALADDMQDDIRTNAFFSQYGGAPVKRVPGNYLQTQEMADAYVRTLVLGEGLVSLEGVAPSPDDIVTGGIIAGETVQAPREPSPIIYQLDSIEEDTMQASELLARIEAQDRKIKEITEKNLTQDALLSGIFKDNNIIQRVSQITTDMGDMRAGRFLALSDGIEPALDGTGAFMSASGETFGSSKYNVGSVKDGKFQAGFNTDGVFSAASELLKIDSDCITQAGTGVFLTASPYANNYFYVGGLQVGTSGRYGIHAFSISGGDLITNGSFATGDTTGWSATGSPTISTDTPAGGYSLIVNNANYVSQTIAVTSGAYYLLSVKIKGVGWMDVDGTGIASGFNPNPVMSTVWAKHIILIKTSSTSLVLSFKGSTSDNVNITDIKLYNTQTVSYSGALADGAGAYGIFGSSSITLQTDGFVYLNTDGTYRPIAPADGWCRLPYGASYVSADSPVFVANFIGDITTTLFPGMRIKLDQTTTKYFIVVAVGAFSIPSTPVTLYGGTDYTLANAAISNVYYSSVKAPFGFPLDPNKWMLSYKNTVDATVTNPTNGVWYNAGSQLLTIPIGAWRVLYQVKAYAIKNGTQLGCGTTLSKANNTQDDLDLSAAVVAVLYSTTNYIFTMVSREKYLTLAAKTIYYLNITSSGNTEATIGTNGAGSTTIIQAICAYL